MALKLTSPAFQDGGDLPARYTCDGEGISPPLAIDGVPGDCQSLVLIVDDPDAPDPRNPQRTWVHWIVYNLPPDLTSVSEGTSAKGLPPGAAEGLNDSGDPGYGSPCPPIGRHRYVHTLFALDTRLPELGPATRADLDGAMAGHVIAEARLVGMYERR